MVLGPSCLEVAKRMLYSSKFFYNSTGFLHYHSSLIIPCTTPYIYLDLIRGLILRLTLFYRWQAEIKARSKTIILVEMNEIIKLYVCASILFRSIPSVIPCTGYAFLIHAQCPTFCSKSCSNFISMIFSSSSSYLVFILSIVYLLEFVYIFNFFTSWNTGKGHKNTLVKKSICTFLFCSFRSLFEIYCPVFKIILLCRSKISSQPGAHCLTAEIPEKW